jgi:hypothetical protein
MSHNVIYKIYPNVTSINGDGENTIAKDKNGNVVTLDHNLINAEIAREEADYASKQYQRDRAIEYPAITDQLDMLYHDKINNTNTWQTAIEAVKNKYPKG